MEKIISSRHFELDDVARAYALDELTKLESEYQKLTSARLVLDIQKAHYVTEIVVRGKNVEIEAKNEAKGLRPAIDGVVAKAHAQLRKYLDKVHDHNKLPVSAVELNRKAEAEQA
jgi:ribosomal subunit interface protein